MKNTHCENCIFSDTTNSSKPCKFDIIDKIKNLKEINIENNHFKIINYLCRFGFSKKAYEANKDTIKDIDLETELISRLRLRYYLFIDARGTEDHDLIIERLLGAKYSPQYISVLVDDHIKAKKYIAALDQDPNRKYGYKIHCVIEQGDISKILPLLLETNLRKNNTQYLWVADKNTISNIDKSIESIQEILQIYQPDCDLITHTISDEKTIYGLFLPFEYYIFIKDRFGSLQNAINSKDSLRIIYYE